MYSNSKRNRLDVGKDVNGVPIYAPNLATQKTKDLYFKASIASGAIVNLTVPANVDTAILSYTAPGVEVTKASTPLSPPGAAFLGDSGLGQPGVIKDLVEGDILQFQNNAAADVVTYVSFCSIER